MTQNVVEEFTALTYIHHDMRMEICICICTCLEMKVLSLVFCQMSFPGTLSEPWIALETKEARAFNVTDQTETLMYIQVMFI